VHPRGDDAVVMIADKSKKASFQLRPSKRTILTF
jgi:hypothetical protein